MQKYTFYMQKHPINPFFAPKPLKYYYKNPHFTDKKVVDLVAAQVKSLSFLTYILRGFSSRLQPQGREIPGYVIELLLR
jgi:hypothetical protein